MNAVYVCGSGPLVRRPCPQGGEDHEPFPTGYNGVSEYAALLLRRRFSQARCPSCGLYGKWLPATATRPEWQA